MADAEPRGPAPRRIGSTVLAALVLFSATLLGVVADHHPARGGPRQGHHRTRTPAASPPAARPPTRGEADGAIRRRVTVFDHDRPAVANLDPDLRHALRRAAMDAANDGVEMVITSGWRSREYQQRLLREAVATYGSKEKAARWVATVETSAHVSGDAVDIGPSRATAWLARHGAAYRLCQIYRNEPWHYELRPDAIDGGCPPMYADPRHDPRMQP